MRSFERCSCGDVACPFCGVAQGYCPTDEDTQELGSVDIEPQTEDTDQIEEAARVTCPRCGKAGGLTLDEYLRGYVCKECDVDVDERTVAYGR